MIKTRKPQKVVISGLLIGALTLASFSGTNFITQQKTKVNAASTNAVKVNASITGEITAKRSKFVKQFSMSDGSYTAAVYSMPVHYQKNGTWQEIDTTLVKSGKKNYKTKATDLLILSSSGKSTIVYIKYKCLLSHRMYADAHFVATWRNLV